MSVKDFTIIIPTIGEDAINKCLECIFNSSIQPNKIIISIPSKYYTDKYLLHYRDNKNIQILKTNVIGQVNQRIEAFKISQTEFILCLDCDVFLEKNCIEKFINAYDEYYLQSSESKTKIILGPIYNYTNKKPVHNYGFQYKNNFYKNIYNLYFYFFHKMPFGIKKMGKVSDTGLPFGVFKLNKEITFFKVDWLPGGCFFSHRSCFLKENYYPLKGKAFTEDIISSFIRRKLGYVHLYVAESFVFIDKLDKFNEDKKYLKNLFDEFRSRYLYIKISNGPKLRFFLWFFIYFFIKCIRYLWSKK